MRLRYSRQGYTLLELSISLAIIGIVVAALAPAYTQEQLIRRNKELAATLDTIEQAMLSYRLKNDKLPCPAGYTDAAASASYGTSAGSAGSCTAAASGSCAGAAPVLCHITANVVSGAVPVHTLGLPDEMMYDPWGRRITYVVDQRMTAASAFTTYKPKSRTGAIEVRDEGNIARNNFTIAILLSHGPNGHGAYTLNGVRISESVTDTKEQSNCKCNSSAAAGTFDNIYYQRSSAQSRVPSANSFDDILRFYTRGNFLSTTDLQVN